MDGGNTATIPLVTKATLGVDTPPLDQFGEFRQVVPTKAHRMEGAFRVEALGGGEPVTIEDGYLAIDARGYPYGVEAAEFDLIYESAS